MRCVQCRFSAEWTRQTRGKGVVGEWSDKAVGSLGVVWWRLESLMLIWKYMQADYHIFLINKIILYVTLCQKTRLVLRCQVPPQCLKHIFSTKKYM